MTSSDPATRFVKAKRWILAALGLLAFAMGVAGQYLYPGNQMPPSDLFFAVAGVLLSFVWYRLDSEQRGYERSALLNVGIVALGIVAFPYYFIRSRGFKRGALATLVFLLLAVMWSVFGVAGQYALWYAVQR